MSKKAKQPVQGSSLIVPNFYPDPPSYNQKGGVIEHPARVLVLGPSGSGKTNLVMFLITDHFDFDTLTVFASNLEQPLFKQLKDYMEKKIKKVGGNLEDYFHMSDTIDKTVEDFDINLQHLVICDDMIAQKSKTGEVVAEFFKKGRPRNISSIAITQNLFNANPQVRENTNYLFSFAVKRPQDRSFIFSTYCASHLSRPQFDQVFGKATVAESPGDRNNFFSVIDTDKAKSLGLMFRRGFIPYSLYLEKYTPDTQPVHLGKNQYKGHYKSADTANFKYPGGPIPRSKYDSTYQKKLPPPPLEEDSELDEVLLQQTFRNFQASRPKQNNNFVLPAQPHRLLKPVPMYQRSQY